MLAVQPGARYQIIMERKRRCHHTSPADHGQGTCLGSGFVTCTPDQIPIQIPHPTSLWVYSEFSIISTVLNIVLGLQLMCYLLAA